MYKIFQAKISAIFFKYNTLQRHYFNMQVKHEYTGNQKVVYYMVTKCFLQTPKHNNFSKLLGSDVRLHALV